ncbi:MAG TPA: hypothetical protein PLV00_07810 [Caldisericia bacterium]|nr:hypothetical protein [Caldisericia bacterium]
MKQKQHTFSKTRFRHMGMILFVVSCFSVSNLCCTSAINGTKTNPSPLFIEDFASSIPDQSPFESDTYDWYEDDGTDIELLYQDQPLDLEVPRSWYVACWRSSNTEYDMYMDTRYIYVDNDDPEYLYKQYDMATGYQNPFLKRNVEEFSFSLGMIRTPPPAVFSVSDGKALQGYTYNQAFAYKGDKWKIKAVEKTENKQTILWEHEIPHWNNGREDYTSWDGFIQYDNILVYTSYTLDYIKRTIKNLITRALSKDTGEVLWEVKNPVQGGTLNFPDESDASVLNKIGRYYYTISKGSCPSDIGEPTLYVINTNTGTMEGKLQSDLATIKTNHLIPASSVLDTDGSLYQIWWRYSQQEKLFTRTNLVTLEDILISSSLDASDRNLLGINQDNIVTFNHTTLAVYDQNTLVKKWSVDNATGYSKVQPDGTMVVILDNQYICHIRLQDGVILQYWNTKKLLREGCTCTSFSNTSCFYPTAVRITPANQAIIFIDEKIPAPPNQVVHNQKILAISLEIPTQQRE